MNKNFTLQSFKSAVSNASDYLKGKGFVGGMLSLIPNKVSNAKDVPIESAYFPWVTS